MLSKAKNFSNFSNTVNTKSYCFRPDTEEQISYILSYPKTKTVLARGNGASYSDCCVNHHGMVVDTQRLNHLLSFDHKNEILYTQAGVTFADLFSIANYVPPIIPGTLRATIAGGVANDVHGKNNHHFGSLGHHVVSLELQLENQSLLCTPTENKQLFYATIGGLGLTGIIKRVAIKMRKAPAFVLTETEKYYELPSLLKRMETYGINFDYQVAWLDLLNNPEAALLSMANHTELHYPKSQHRFSIPKLPCRLIYHWSMQLFNKFYFNHSQTKPQVLPLSYFNNPLDSIQHWNRLYGKKGVIQFQAVFDREHALYTIQNLLSIIRAQKATPALSVLKYFTKPGNGMLSFAQPGFTLAIDFVHNLNAQKTVRALNAFITEIKGKNYLAKDLFLTPEQFRCQYTQHEQFSSLLSRYPCSMRSNLSRRLEITS